MILFLLFAWKFILPQPAPSEGALHPSSSQAL
jgi:hypothetical protein